MGKRFDAWVAEFESWGMTHDEAVAHARTWYRSKMALAFDELEQAISDVASASLFGRLWRWVRRPNTGDGETT
jgi:predicted ATPase